MLAAGDLSTCAGPRRGTSSPCQQDLATLESLSLQLLELRLSLSSLETERDFYFGKLTRIEAVVEHEDGQPAATIKDILYKSDE